MNDMTEGMDRGRRVWGRTTWNTPQLGAQFTTQGYLRKETFCVSVIQVMHWPSLVTCPFPPRFVF